MKLSKIRGLVAPKTWLLLVAAFTVHCSGSVFEVAIKSDLLDKLELKLVRCLDASCAYLDSNPTHLYNHDVNYQIQSVDPSLSTDINIYFFC